MLVSFKINNGRFENYTENKIKSLASIFVDLEIVTMKRLFVENDLIDINMVLQITLR